MIIFDAQERDGKQVDSTCGIVIGGTNKRPSIHLFEISENEGVPISGNIFQGCREIRDRIFPGVQMDNIDWRLTKSLYDTPIKFSERNGWITKVSLERGMDMGNYFKMPISDYEEALNDRAGLEYNLTGGRDFSGNPLTLYPVALPKHPDGYMLFKRNYEVPHMVDDYEVVLASSEKLLSAWKRQTGSFEPLLEKFNLSSEDELRQQNWATGYDSVLLSSPVKDSLEHMWGQDSENAPDMPHLSFGRYTDHTLGFVNGRHRLFNAMNAGAPYVPVELHRDEDVRYFKDRFQWKWFNEPAIDLKPHCHFETYA